MSIDRTAPIVVGVDGSPAAEQALRWAMDEAVVRGCPLRVVNVWDYEPLVDWTMTLERDKRAHSEALIENAVRMASIGRTELPVIVRRSVRGSAAETLENEARGAALLVVAAHSERRIRRLGPTSTHCVQHATVPVVVVPPRETA